MIMLPKSGGKRMDECLTGTIGLPHCVARRELITLAMQTSVAFGLIGCSSRGSDETSSNDDSGQIQQKEASQDEYEDAKCWVLSSVTRYRVGETTTIDFEIDDHGNRIASMHWLGEGYDPVRNEWDYDEYGNVISAYDIDESGNRVYGSQFENTLNEDGLVTRATDGWSGKWIDYEYYSDGKMRSRSYNSLGSEEFSEYDQDGWLIQWTYLTYANDNESSVASLVHVGEARVESSLVAACAPESSDEPTEMSCSNNEGRSAIYEIEWDAEGNVARLATDAESYEYSYIPVEDPSAGALCASMRRPNIVYMA